MFNPKPFDRVVIHKTGEPGTVVDRWWSHVTERHTLLFNVELDTPRDDDNRVICYLKTEDLGPLIREETRP